MKKTKKQNKTKQKLFLFRWALDKGKECCVVGIGVLLLPLCCCTLFLMGFCVHFVHVKWNKMYNLSFSFQCSSVWCACVFCLQKRNCSFRILIMWFKLDKFEWLGFFFTNVNLLLWQQTYFQNNGCFERKTWRNDMMRKKQKRPSSKKLVLKIELYSNHLHFKSRFENWITSIECLTHAAYRSELNFTFFADFQSDKCDGWMVASQCAIDIWAPPQCEKERKKSRQIAKLRVTKSNDFVIQQ